MNVANLIAGASSSEGAQRIRSVNPVTKVELPGDFPTATAEEVDRAGWEAATAWRAYRSVSGKEKARFLRQIADNIEALGEQLVNRATEESGLSEGRIKGERGRTCNQLRLFADLVEEGRWVNATIDTALPGRKPPRVDIRKLNRALGPVAVFGASNFPLAFSTAGGDTASALAAGCPVVVKGHPSHSGTHVLISGAITKAVKDCGLPAGVFSSLNGGIETGQQLVRHPAIKAVGFTGSERGGTALMRAATERPEPIPVYAEMGSINPVFLLSGAVDHDHAGLAADLAGSVNLGAGQFCTNPGVLVLAPTADEERFLKQLTEAFSKLAAATMLNEGVNHNYESLRTEFKDHDDVETAYFGKADDTWTGQPTLVTTTAAKFSANPGLQREVFGPMTLVVRCGTDEEVLEVARSLRGQLTCTIMHKDNDLDHALAKPLADILSEKAGRLIYNGVPTGVEVGYAMHHGGPFPAASSPMYTSVGTDAIFRFVRPLCLQNAPSFMLPEELQDGNPLGIWRTVNGELSKEGV